MHRIPIRPSNRRHLPLDESLTASDRVGLIRPTRSNNGIHDIAVVGAGAAGTMAAIRASQFKKRVLLIERNPLIGKKIRMTGKGRCNVTNIAPLDIFVEKFERAGQFLRHAFFAFSNTDLINFFESKGLKLRDERQGRVFPVTYRARSIAEVLNKSLIENNVEILYKARVINIEKETDHFTLRLRQSPPIKAKKVILATGGSSYRATGSTGDGFQIAKRLGHRIAPLLPGLVPLRTEEEWVRQLQGLSLKNIRITFSLEGKKDIVSDIGEIMFTHFGVSGPLVLDLSGEIISMVKKQHKSESRHNFFIDLKPALGEEKINERLIREFRDGGNRELKNILKNLMPIKLVDIFMRLCGINRAKKGSQITREERQKIAKLLKALPLSIVGSLSLDRAMITLGGVSTKEINPKTMESSIVPGLYFAGEVIEGGAPSGGYNLQAAFSTGYLAGEAAANA